MRVLIVEDEPNIVLSLEILLRRAGYETTTTGDGEEAMELIRRTRPDAPRPYRTWGYPFVPVVFVLASLAMAANTLLEKPKESLFGLAILALGLPAYAWWRRSARQG
jgi:CheY-like chemotaxis protein